jgi:hypothetical protein
MNEMVEVVMMIAVWREPTTKTSPRETVPMSAMRVMRSSVADGTKIDVADDAADEVDEVGDEADVARRAVDE